MQHAEEEFMKKGGSLVRLILAHVVVATLLLGVAAQGFCAEKFWVDAEGYVIFRNDRGDIVKKEFNRYRDVLFEEKAKKVGYFICDYDSIETQVAVRDVKMVKMDPMIEYGAVLTMSADKRAVYIPMDLANSLTNMNHLEINFYNDLTKREEIGFILGTDILEIHFTDTSKVSK